jgi:hypothetical protein
VKRFGWKPDTGRHPRRLLQALHLSAALAGAADLRPCAPSVQDQCYCGSCVGHGASCGITTAYAVAGRPLFGLGDDGHPVPCSPRDGYAGARCLDRNGARVELQDVGTEVLSVVEYANQFGCRRTDAPMTETDPETGAQFEVNSDCVLANVNDEPALLELEEDYAHPVALAHEITSCWTPRFSMDVALALDAGYPVVFGTYVDSAFLRFRGGSVVGAQDRQDPNGGGHSMCILGYRTTPEGKREYLVRNSWGKGWGDSGDCWVNEDFMAQVWEAFAIVPGGES